EMAGEIAARLHAVDDRDDIPRHLQRPGHLVVAPLVRREPAGGLRDRRLATRTDEARLVEDAVLAGELPGQRGHLSPPCAAAPPPGARRRPAAPGSVACRGSARRRWSSRSACP